MDERHFQMTIDENGTVKEIHTQKNTWPTLEEFMKWRKTYRENNLGRESVESLACFNWLQIRVKNND